MLTERLELAIEAFEAAADLSPGTAGVLSDLAAAYLVRAASDDRPQGRLEMGLDLRLFIGGVCGFVP